MLSSICTSRRRALRKSVFPVSNNGLPHFFWGTSLLAASLRSHFPQLRCVQLRDPMLLSQLDPLPRVDRMGSCPKIDGSGTGRWADETLVVDHSAWEAPQDARPRTETQTRGVVR